MAQIRIFPYKMGSQSASRLAELLRQRGHRVFKVFPDRNYRPRRNHLVVNWGNGTPPTRWEYFEDRILNMCGPVRRGSNKLDAFGIMQGAGVSIPEFTTRWGEADDWMQQDGHTIVVRNVLQGHSGEGITIVQPNTDDLPEAPLYVKYIKKMDEYRIHVFRGQIIDIQQKRKRRDADDVDYQVRSHNNGWVFCRSDVQPAKPVLDNAVAAIGALGLDFGAVDVIWNNRQGQAYVLEVNTAPGLEGSTVESYANAIEEAL